MNYSYNNLIQLNFGILSHYSNEEQKFIESNEPEQNYFKIKLLKPIVQVVDIYKIGFCERTKNNSYFGDYRYRIDLTDGKQIITCTIDKVLHQFLVPNIDYTTEHNISKTNFDYKNEDLKIASGSLLIINKVKLLPIEFLFSEDECDELKHLKNIICLTGLNVIGFNNPKNTINPNNLELTNTNTKNEIHTNNLINVNENLELTHTISELEPCLSRFFWSIKCKIVAKTPIRAFDRNGNKGRYMRLLLLDSTEQIEAVVFDELCESNLISSIRLNQYFIIRNGEIKIRQTKTKTWNDRTTSRFEIKFNKTTEIFEISNDIKRTENNDTKCEFQSKFVKFSDIILQDPKVEFDILGLVFEIDNLKTTIDRFQKKLSLLHIQMIDNTLNKINVSFWGKQAESFNFRKGTCLIIKKVKITNYKGITIMVQRVSEVHEINFDTTINEAKKMMEWWQAKNKDSEFKAIEDTINESSEKKIVSNISRLSNEKNILKPKNKRDIQEIDDEYFLEMLKVKKDSKDKCLFF